MRVTRKNCVHKVVISASSQPVSRFDPMTDGTFTNRHFCSKRISKLLINIYSRARTGNLSFAINKAYCGCQDVCLSFSEVSQYNLDKNKNYLMNRVLARAPRAEGHYSSSSFCQQKISSGREANLQCCHRLGGRRTHTKR